MMIEQLIASWSLWSYGLALLALGSLGLIIYNVLEERKIQSLGGRAPWISRLPFGIDTMYDIVRATLSYQNHEWFIKVLEMGNRHTVEGFVGGERLVFTDDPENIKAVLATQFRDFGKGSNFHHRWQDFLGESIFTTDLDQWHASRQLIRPQFIKDRVSDLDIFEKHISKLLPLLGGNGKVVDIESLLFRYTLDIATDFLLGFNIDSLNQPQAKFAEAFAFCQQHQAIVARMGLLYKLVPRRKFKRSVKIIDNFINPFIERTLRLSPAELEKTKSDSNYTFLHALAGFTRDPKVIRDQIIAVLLAGRDTTAGTLSFAFVELSRNPEVVRKLREEILSMIGPNRAPTYSDLKSMKYLQHVISETLRLYPGVPFNMRYSLTDTSIPRGGGKDGLGPVGFPAGTAFVWSTITMQRRPDLYPSIAGVAAPEVFSPERWDKWQPPPWTYIPFHGGPRICIGQQFALTEMAYTIVRIFQRFDAVERRWADEDILPRTEIVIQPAEKVDVVFRAVQHGEEKKNGL